MDQQSVFVSGGTEGAPDEKDRRAGGQQIWRESVQGNGPEFGTNWLPVCEDGQERQDEALQMEFAMGQCAVVGSLASNLQVRSEDWQFQDRILGSWAGST